MSRKFSTQLTGFGEAGRVDLAGGSPYHHLMHKTNAMRILESLGISYTTQSYDWDEDHIDAKHVCEELHLDPEQVFKTIVLEDSDKQKFVFCLPAESVISMKRVREITGSKTIDLLPLKDLQKTTGYIRGGCSPLGMIRKFPTYIEETAQLFDTIYVSAGMRGLQLCLRPDDLLKAAEATWADFTQA